MKRLLAEPQSLAITRNEARVQIILRDDGALWLEFKTPKGTLSVDVKHNFSLEKDPLGISSDFFQRVEAGDKLCDGCRFRQAVSTAIENAEEVLT